MQSHFAYSPTQLASIERLLSKERLGPYMALASFDMQQAIMLYERNTALSEALYGLLQGLEIPLRNAMHLVLSSGLGNEEWYDFIVWRPAQQDQVDNAKESLRAKGKPVSAGRKVAELTFGFWVGLTGPKYSVDLWEKHLYKAFPNAKLGRKLLNRRLESIRLLRNRVAHHEPILARDLPKDVERILETIGWINTDLKLWTSKTTASASAMPAER